MPSIERRDLREILEEVLPEDEETRAEQIVSSSIQCIGIEITVGPMSAPRVELINLKLDKKEKRSLSDSARELLGTSAAAASLRQNGRFEFDSATEMEVGAERRPHTRLFYAQEKTIQWAETELLPCRLRAWAFASERPSSPFTPLGLRTVFDRLESTARARFEPPSRDNFASAINGGALGSALRMLGELYPALAGLVLWQYDEMGGRYKSLQTEGTGKAPFDVPINRTNIQGYRGVVAQVMPDRQPVVYDADDQSLWRPAIDGSWQPFDKDFFRSREWRSCMAIPIVTAGRLIGALSAYSPRSARVFEEIEEDLTRDASICAAAILSRRDQEVIADLSARYDEELLTGNVSLQALSLSHDILHSFRTVGSSVEQALGFLQTRPPQLDQAMDFLDESKRTMAATKPAIAAMVRLATEARTPTGGPQVTFEPEKLFAELRQLLRSILPHFTDSERLKANCITVSLKGDPRNIEIAQLTLERIVVNLCVNAAQWKANNVWVTGHFDRSDEFELVVRDDGQGIHPSIRDQVFDRFFSRRQQGSGLGLYVVKSLVTQADGEVYLQSYHRTDKADETGTVVTVVLPTSDQEPRT